MSLKNALFFSLMFHLAIFPAQEKDSVRTKLPKVKVGSTGNPQFSNDAVTSSVDSIVHPEINIGAYVSTYYAHYDDETEFNNFVQFPTLAPRNNQFSLNMALISMDYKSNNLRSAISIHAGDIALSSYPAVFNFVQEANAGFKIIKNLWLDAGFFKSHIGLESFQPRENITSSMSIPSYYNPYYLSGAKLTYYLNAKISLQVASYNGYNVYVDDNKNKAFAFTANYTPIKDLSLTYNFLTCDETHDPVTVKHQRYHQNFYATLIREKYSIGLDLTFGLQQNSLRSDTSKMASMFSGSLVGKYVVYKTLSLYGRVEYFSDPNEILTGTLDIGAYIKGITAGLEYRPQKNVALSGEWRGLQSDKLIFKQGNVALNQRNEIIVCLDLWF